MALRTNKIIILTFKTVVHCTRLGVSVSVRVSVCSVRIRYDCAEEADVAYRVVVGHRRRVRLTLRASGRSEERRVGKEC